MNIKLIYPSTRKSNPTLRHWRQPKSHRYPGLGLLTVASLCPSSAAVTILDDDFEEPGYGLDTDLVGISVLTLNAYRAYEIAGNFRERRIPVVLGGMHVSSCPEEALEHADAVVIGEAEDTWPALLRDFNAGRLQRIYRSANSADLANRPFPRRDLLNKRHYTTVNTVQATRGCPWKCDFCSMTSMLSSATRFRPVDEVIEEIGTLEGNVFVLNDDNIAQASDYYKEFFRKLIPMRRIWAGEASWNIVQDGEILDLLSRSGCRAIHVGFDSLQSQPGVRKTNSPAAGAPLYHEVVRALQKRNICVFGAFVFGFDNEDKTVFEETLRFSIASGMEVVQFNILTPYPGTRLYQRLKAEGRICETSWNHYMSSRLCFRPQNMSRDAFLKGFTSMKKAYFSYLRIGQRLLRSAPRRGLFETGLLLGINLGYKKGIRNILR
jgi:radical SAM superfamily enzyme YgiQ (UPF0313 family)